MSACFCEGLTESVFEVFFFTCDSEGFWIESFAFTTPLCLLMPSIPISDTRIPCHSVHGKTGLLCDDTPESFSNAMLRLLRDKRTAKEMGAEGRRRVVELFSLSSFSLRLDATIRDIVKV